MEKLEKTKQCKECCRDITEDDYNTYDRYCKICYKDKEQDDDYNEDDEERKTNFIAQRIKGIAGIIITIGIIAGIIMCSSMEEFVVLGVIVIVGSIITAIFIYGFGEIIQLLEDIKNK